MSHHLSEDAVRKIARLARLELRDEEVGHFQRELSAVIGYMDRLRGIDLSGVEPLASVEGGVNRLDDDVPGPTLSNEVLMRMSPGTMAPFVRVPKVSGAGGGA